MWIVLSVIFLDGQTGLSEPQFILESHGSSFISCSLEVNVFRTLCYESSWLSFSALGHETV